MQHSKTRTAGTLAACLMLLATTGWSDDWTTLGFDAQRSSWIRADLKTSAETVRSGSFQFLWKIELPNHARDGNALTAPALLDFLISHRGFRSLAFLSGSSGGVFAIDTDLARMEWERRFPVTAIKSSADCPGGITAGVTRPTAAAMPSPLGFSARGRREPARSGVGSPGEGAVTLRSARRPFRRPPTQSPRGSRTRPPARTSLRGITPVYALSATGTLHTVYASNGRDHVPPIPFLPPNANARGLIVVAGFAYVATANECGGVPDGVWALNLETGEVATWESDGGAVAGLGGLAMGPDGTVFVTTRQGPLVALEERTLAVRSTSQAAGYLASPVVFDIEGEDHVAALAGDGALQVYKARDLAEPVAAANAIETNRSSETALAVWKTPDGTPWILAPAGQSIAAWRLSLSDSKLKLERAWTSPAMARPLPPIIVNGVVFAVDGGGESANATLYALEGADGSPIWDSGDVIQSTASGITLSAGPGHVYLTTADSSVYAFGFPMEH